jgi:hypothetical protein
MYKHAPGENKVRKLMPIFKVGTGVYVLSIKKTIRMLCAPVVPGRVSRNR